MYAPNNARQFYAVCHQCENSFELGPIQNKSYRRQLIAAGEMATLFIEAKIDFISII